MRMLWPNKLRIAKALVLCALLGGATTVQAWDEVPQAQGAVIEDAPEIQIEAYGDSLTAAFLSSTDLTNPPSLSEIGKIVSDLARYALTKNWKYLNLHHSPKLSWANLVSEKYAAEGHKVKLSNFAVSGAKTHDLLSQVKQGRKEVGMKTVALFFIGHNDLCNNNNTPAAMGTKFAKSYNVGLAAWDAAHENDVAYLVPLGDIYRALEKMRGYVWYQGKEGKYACEDSWERLFPYCPSYSKKLKDGTLDSFVTPRIKAMNGELSGVADRWNKETKRNNKFIYLKDIHDYAFEVKYFAVDCFHLSKNGQIFFADRAWNTISKN